MLGITLHSKHNTFRPLALMLLALLVLAGCTVPGPTPVTNTPATNTPATNTPAAVITSPLPATTAVIAQPPATATVTNQVAGAPQQLRAETSDTVIMLTWQALPDAKGYFVYRDGNEKPLFPDPLSATTYTDIGLTNGRTYTYTVAAVDQSGKPGPKTNPVQATPRAK